MEKGALNIQGFFMIDMDRDGFGIFVREVKKY